MGRIFRKYSSVDDLFQAITSTKMQLFSLYWHYDISLRFFKLFKESGIHEYC